MAYESRVVPPSQIQRERGWNGPLPFYMTHPQWGMESSAVMGAAMQDLEYLQQMYPAQVQKCRKRIVCLLDRLDYEGSMIYDEYPDRCSLQNFVETVKKVLEQEEENPPAEELVQVLVFLELVKRRNEKRHKSSLYLF